jgi:Cyclic nucleotide-binding domain/HEAT repeats/HEAT repeat
VARLSSDRSVDPLIDSLGDPDPGVREAAAEGLARLGPAVTARLVEALSRGDLEAGALTALIGLPGTEPSVFRAYATQQASQASRYHTLWRRLHPDGDERLALVASSVRDRALRHTVSALRAVSPLGDRAAMDLALENLRSVDAQQRANALEILEAVGEPELIRPLLAVWEGHAEPGRDEPAVIAELLSDDDPWLRACAAFAAAATGDPGVAGTLEEMARSDHEPLVREAAAVTRREGDGDVETLSTLSTMERVLFLRKVRLFSDLAPPDLKQIAEIASEHVFADGEVIAEQGEAGDEMHIVVAGEIRVMLQRDGGPDQEVARRTPGDYVGEMAIISEEPRMASLVGSGEVRTLGIDRRRFERILRDRPETSLAVMRVLCERLKESHAHQPIGARI